MGVHTGLFSRSGQCSDAHKFSAYEEITICEVGANGNGNGYDNNVYSCIHYVND